MRTKGVSLVEYGLVVGFIGVVSAGAMILAGEEVENTFCVSASRIAAAFGAERLGCDAGPVAEAGPVNVAPRYEGPSIVVPDLLDFSEMTPVRVEPFIDDESDALSYAMIGDWPDGVALSEISYGVIQIEGSPLEHGLFAGLRIRVSDATGSSVTPPFAIRVEPSAEIWGAGVVGGFSGPQVAHDFGSEMSFIAGQPDFSQVYACQDDAYGVDGAGDLHAIGYSSNGEVFGAAGAAVTAWTRSPVTGLSVTDLACSGSSVAVLVGGQVHVAGSRSAFGLPDTQNLTLTPGPQGYVDIANAGSNALLAIRGDGSVWGLGGTGVLVAGSGFTEWTRIGADSDFDRIWGRTGNFFYGRRIDGSIWAMGSNTGGVLGSDPGLATTMPGVWYMVAPGSGWIDASLGSGHAYLINGDGSIWGVGENGFGQIGGSGDRFTLLQVGADSDWIAVSAGSLSGYALKADGSLWSIGYAGPSGVGGHGDHATFLRVGDDEWSEIEGGLGFVLTRR